MQRKHFEGMISSWMEDKEQETGRLDNTRKFSPLSVDSTQFEAWNFLYQNIVELKTLIHVNNNNLSQV